MQLLEILVEYRDRRPGAGRGRIEVNLQTQRLSSAESYFTFDTCALAFVLAVTTKELASMAGRFCSIDEASPGLSDAVLNRHPQ
jgi:hypothetical protein